LKKREAIFAVRQAGPDGWVGGNRVWNILRSDAGMIVIWQRRAVPNIFKCPPGNNGFGSGAASPAMKCERSLGAQPDSIVSARSLTCS